MTSNDEPIRFRIVHPDRPEGEPVHVLVVYPEGYRRPLTAYERFKQPVQPADRGMDFEVRGAIDREPASVEALMAWLRAAPLRIVLGDVEIGGDAIDLQDFETTADRLIRDEFQTD
jgi:hypothetical protein